MEATKEKSGEMMWIWLAIGTLAVALLGLGGWVCWKLNKIQEAIERNGKKRGNGEPPEEAVIDMAPIHSEEVPTTETALALSPATPLDPQPITEFHHSEDFRTVIHNGETHTLTFYQSLALEKLWKARQNQIPAMHQDSILEGIGACSKRLRDIFKSNMKAFRALIVREHKGMYRLNLS